MKNSRLNLRISDEDLAVIKSKVKKSKLTLTKFVTDVALGKQIVVINDLQEVLKEQKEIANKLTELSKLARSGKTQVIYLKDMRNQLFEINKTLKEVLERKRWNGGNS
ncbi:MAG: plasmid mobilization relaxosome protein MobC [Clostridia bacterium]